MAGRSPALRRVAPVALFGVLPAVVVIAMFTVALTRGPLALDFHNELYPEAEELLAGRDPFRRRMPTSRGARTSSGPLLGPLVVSPLTVLPPRVADIAIAVLGLACIALALWLVGVRDWRVFGMTALWPQVVAEIRISHLTPLICLLAAVAWRYRDGTFRPGTALGFAGAIKFFLWPLGLWLLAIGRRGAAVVAGAVASASLLLVLPFTGLDDFARLLVDLGRAFDQDAYSLFGLLTRLDAPEPIARAAPLVLGAVLLVGTWRRQSFALAIAASLVLAPIVWFDYYAIVAVPLAVARPRLCAAWFLPLATWGLPSSGIAADELLGVGRVLAVFAIVLFVAARTEGRDRHSPVTSAI